MTRISIAMATYNGERHIREQLDSIARQTTLPCELVVTDDRSTDATLSIVEDFARGAPFPVRIHLNEERLNWPENFMCAASLCSGDWIAFCDQDDIWVDHKLAVVEERIRGKPDVLLLIHAISSVDEEARPLGWILPSKPVDGPITYHAVLASRHMGLAMVLHPEVIRLARRMKKPSAHLYPHNILGHDRWTFMIGTTLGKVESLKDVLVLYRQHESQVTSAWRTKRSRFFHQIHVLRTTSRTEGLQVPARFAEWADILEDFSHENAEFAKRARAASLFYRQQARMYGLRTQCYDPDRLARLRALARLAGTGCYFSKQRGGLGVSGFVADAIKIIL